MYNYERGWHETQEHLEPHVTDIMKVQRNCALCAWSHIRGVNCFWSAEVCFGWRSLVQWPATTPRGTWTFWNVWNSNVFSATSITLSNCFNTPILTNMVTSSSRRLALNKNTVRPTATSKMTARELFLTARGPIRKVSLSGTTSTTVACFFLPVDNLYFSRAIIVVCPLAQLTTFRTWKFLLELVNSGLARSTSVLRCFAMVNMAIASWWSSEASFASRTSTSSFSSSWSSTNSTPLWQDVPNLNVEECFRVCRGADTPSSLTFSVNNSNHSDKSRNRFLGFCWISPLVFQYPNTCTSTSCCYWTWLRIIRCILRQRCRSRTYTRTGKNKLTTLGQCFGSSSTGPLATISVIFAEFTQRRRLQACRGFVPSEINAKSWTHTLASSFVCTSPLADIAVVGLLESNSVKFHWLQNFPTLHVNWCSGVHYKLSFLGLTKMALVRTKLLQAKTPWLSRSLNFLTCFTIHHASLRANLSCCNVSSWILSSNF